MIKSLIGKIKRVNTSLLSRNRFTFYNEVPKFDPSKDYYSILEVSKNSSDSEIKRQYYTLAKRYHPDSNKGFEAKFKQINQAYTVLSDPKVKRQYDSARLMTGFSRKMGSKAGKGSFDYKEYQAEFHNLSPEERQQLVEEFRRKARKVIIFGIVMIVVLPFLTRRNHRYYVVDHGELVPVEFEGGMMGGMSPPPGMMGPHGAAPYPGQQPYGQQQVYPFSQNPPQGYQSAYNSPYADVARNVGGPNPYGGYQRQPNYQQGYSGYSGPQ